MLSIMLMSADEREAQILTVAFAQRGIQIITSAPTYANYIKVLQYRPDLILLELPRMCSEQLHFSSLIRKHRQTRTTYILGFGDTVPDGIKRGFLKKGISYYLERPLKLNTMMDLVEKQARQLKKELQEKPKTDKERDVEQIWNHDTLFSQKIENITRHVAKLLAFPFTVAKVLHLTDSQESSAHDLARVIEADPVISVSILKVSNSVFFATGNKKINSIRDAIMRIGFREAKRIVMGMAVMNLFSTQNKNLGFDRMDFWYHSLTAALIAERLARSLGEVSAEEAFLAGLLHDFGLIVYDEFFPAILAKLLEKNAQKAGHFVETEKSLLDFTHNDVAATLLKNWNLPDNIVGAITCQQSFDSFRDLLADPGKRLGLCVGVGNCLAKTLMIGSECDQFVPPLDNWIFQAMGMPAGIGAEFLNELAAEIEMYRKFFKLEDRDFLHPERTVEPSPQLNLGLINFSDDAFIAPTLYLQRQGLTVRLLEPEADSAVCLSPDLSACILWTGSETTIKQLMERVPAALRTRKSASSPAQTPPMIVFVKKSSPLWESPALKETFALPAACDLRHLDRILGQLGSGDKGQPMVERRDS